MIIALFDVDGTLAPSGQIICNEMLETIKKMHQKNIVLGIVGGGKYEKIVWQIGEAVKYFTYIFPECGAIKYYNGVKVFEKNMLDHCDRSVLNSIIRVAMKEIAQMPIVYHGCQTDFRKGLVYISPPGLQATEYERGIFMELDSKENIRKKLIRKLKEKDPDDIFDISLGGAVGIAVHPKGWDKSQVMTELDIGTEDTVYYFGDRTEPDGNDYPLYSHPDVIGVAVTDDTDTITKINQILLIN